jgi:hypothetical protein
MTRALAILAVLARTASADDAADDLVAQGEEAARNGDYTRSIVMFKAADVRAPRALNACMIGLAYLRRELWPQAEVFFADCRRRSTAADALPEWLPDAEQQLATKLASLEVAPVQIVVDPPGAHATISISSFAPDEHFEPRTLHLAPGKHTIEASAPGFVTASETIVISSRARQTVTFELQRPPSKVPLYVMGGGVALGLAGAIYTLVAVKPVYDELDATTDMARYATLKQQMQSRRIVEGALFSSAVVAIGLGLVLRYTAAEHEPSVRVSATVGNGGGGIAIAWDR